MFAIKSLWNRRFVVAMTIASVALSVALVVSVERLQSGAKKGFSSSVSGIDLIVAARGNPVQILLATAFGVGATSNGISWATFQMIQNMPQVRWAVPISIGDNHRGFPVIGTDRSYFDLYRFDGGQGLQFEHGKSFSKGNGAVVGSEVARRFSYKPGVKIVLSHGAGEVAFHEHDEAPFEVTGVLAPTGTSADRMVFVSLDGFDNLHIERSPQEADPLGRLSGTGPLGEEVGGNGTLDKQLPANNEQSPTLEDRKRKNSEHDHDHIDDQHSEPRGSERAGDQNRANTINAIFIGLTDRAASLSVQRALSEYRLEPLAAVMPNVTLLELWAITGVAETAMSLMAAAVVLASLVGMVAMLSATLEARRREFAILRSIGATPASIFGMIVLEAVIIVVAGTVAGFFLISGIVQLAAPVLAANYGLRLGVAPQMPHELWLALAVLGCGIVASLVPASRVYSMTLADGLTPKI